MRETISHPFFFFIGALSNKIIIWYKSIEDRSVLMMKYAVLALCAAIVTANVAFSAPINEACKKKKRSVMEKVDSCDNCKKKTGG